jgi:superfamily II DNA or RNA helicase
LWWPAQTLRNLMRRRMITDVGLIVVDECHHGVADSYLQVLGHYGAWGDGEPVDRGERAVAVGFTATMMRGDDKALGDVWQDVVYARPIGEMVTAGYLVRPRGIRVYVDDLNLAGVKRSRGDYAAGDLGRAIEESQAPEAVVKAIAEHCPQDPGIIFTPTVETARIMTGVMADAGASVRMVWGDMAADARKRALDEYRACEVDWLVNPQLLTEGTDLPRAKVAVIARPTRSAGLTSRWLSAAAVSRQDGGVATDPSATAEHSLRTTIAIR